MKNIFIVSCFAFLALAMSCDRMDYAPTHTELEARSIIDTTKSTCVADYLGKTCDDPIIKDWIVPISSDSLNPCPECDHVHVNAEVVPCRDFSGVYDEFTIQNLTVDFPAGCSACLATLPPDVMAEWADRYRDIAIEYVQNDLIFNYAIGSCENYDKYLTFTLIEFNCYYYCVTSRKGEYSIVRGTCGSDCCFTYTERCRDKDGNIIREYQGNVVRGESGCHSPIPSRKCVAASSCFTSCTNEKLQ